MGGGLDVRDGVNLGYGNGDEVNMGDGDEVNLISFPVVDNFSFSLGMNLIRLRMPKHCTKCMQDKNIL